MLNTGERLGTAAARCPDRIAIAEPIGHGRSAKRDKAGKRLYRTITFRELSDRVNRIAAGLKAFGVKRGMRMVLLVHPGTDFVALVYALFLTGAVVVMIDPGMGFGKMLQCLAQVQPDGFVAISAAQALRVLHKKKFPKARLNVTVGCRWGWGGTTLRALERCTLPPSVEPTEPDDPAAIIFTSGSTGPAKGVLYTHRIICAQVDEIGNRFSLGGGVDLAGFPFFGLYDAALGTTMVVPDMDTTRPASVDPELFLETAADWQITQAFASPALWNRVVRYAAPRAKTIPTLRLALSSGAPFPVALLGEFLHMIAPDGDIFTPYGATESLPVAAIGAREILSETAEKTRHGRGTCVGKRFDQIRWKIIPITDTPLPRLEDIPPVLPGTIGELVVTGPQVTRRYVTRVEANALSKITDREGSLWHRIGDLGWIDDQERFWFCGRKAHRVETFANGTLFSVPCESIFNTDDRIARSALAGYPDPEHPDYRIPVIYLEPKRWPKSDSEKRELLDSMRTLAQSSHLTNSITDLRLIRQFPVDIRHNAKINRELLSLMAERDQ